jgi:steroid 5-alpha reductase family enzyme
MSAAAQAYSASPLVRVGNLVFRYRNALFPAVLLLLFLGFRPQYPRGSERLDNLLDALGIAVALTGQLLRFAVIGYVYIIRGGKNRRVYAEGLVTEGFFAHSRNPLYLGNLLVLFGLFLIHNNPWVYGLGVPFFLFSYAVIVAASSAPSTTPTRARSRAGCRGSAASANHSAGCASTGGGWCSRSTRAPILGWPAPLFSSPRRRSPTIPTGSGPAI